MNVVLGGDFHRNFILEKWRFDGSKGRVSLWNDSFGLEVFHELVVWIVQVEFKLFN